MKIAFLIGSGTSITLGLPDTQKITDSIFPLKDVLLSSDSHFYIGKPNIGIPEESEYNEIINKILAFIIEEIKGSDKYHYKNTKYKRYFDVFLNLYSF